MAESHSGSLPPPPTVQVSLQESVLDSPSARTQDAPSTGVDPPLSSSATETEKTKMQRKTKGDTPLRTWCTDEQWAFLTALLPVYVEHTQARDHGLLVSFYETTLGEWRANKWTWEEMGTTKQPVRGPDDNDEAYGIKVKARAKAALVNWFKNRSKQSVRPASGDKLLTSFLKDRSVKALAPAAAYLRLYYEERNMKKIIDERYAEYGKSLEEGESKMGMVAFRMKVAAELLKKEPLDVQEEVKNYCKRTKSSDYEERDDFKNFPPEEATRLGNALRACRTAASLPQILESFLEITFKHTRFRGIVALVGPDFQDTGNEAHYIVCTQGSTPDKLSIDEYSRYLQPFLHSLQQWGQQCLTAEDKAFYSLQPRTPPLHGDPNTAQETPSGPSSSSAVTASSSALSRNGKHPVKRQRTNNGDGESTGDQASARARVGPLQSDSDSSAESSDDEDNEDASGLGVTIAEKMLRPDYAKFSAIGEDYLSFSVEPELGPVSLPTVPSTINAPCDNELPAVEHHPTPSCIDPSLLCLDQLSAVVPRTIESACAPVVQLPRVPSPSCSPRIVSFANEKENLEDAPTAIVTTAVHDTQKSVLVLSKSVNKPVADEDMHGKSPKKAIRKTKGPAVRKQPAVNEPAGDPAWSVEAGTALRQNLKGPNAREAVERWQRLEECQGFPKSTKAANSLPLLKAAPDCLQQFLAAGRSADFEPDRDAEALAVQFKTFWTALQPSWRQASGVWPLPKNNMHAQDWTKLNRGGPNGFYLILKVMSFWSAMAWYADERSAFEEAIADVNWVLGEILTAANGGSVLGKRRRRL